MIKTVGIVSLSSGVLGEDFVKHEVELGLKRLKDYGLNVKFLPHALRGIEYLKAHPEKRAEDLLEAFCDPEIDLILCAIGGDDTYRLLPRLFDDGKLQNAVCDKIFLGFSDTTVNHFMLHKVGLKTFYGQSFLSDVCELAPEMLPYTKRCFEELITTGTIRRVTPSDTWYEERKDYGADQIGTAPVSHKDRGFELLQGAPIFSGKILGGCIDSIFDFFDGGRYADMPALCHKYRLFPDEREWRGRILLLESSEERMPPEQYEKALRYLKDTGVFRAVNGVLVGKPIDGVYEEEYKACLVKVIDRSDLSVLCNVNIGHASPRCILPFGVPATVDAVSQTITFF